MFFSCPFAFLGTSTASLALYYELSKVAGEALWLYLTIFCPKTISFILTVNSSCKGVVSTMDIRSFVAIKAITFMVLYRELKQNKEQAEITLT